MLDKRTNSLDAGRVILTYGRSLMALVIARSLAQRGVEVIGCDDVDLTVLSFSKHVQECFTVAPWRSRPQAFLDDLEAAVLEYAPRDGRPYVLMPVFAEAELIARNRDRFEPAIKVAAPSWKSIDLVHPKDHLARLATKAGLPAPRSWIVRRARDLSATVADLEYPLVLKPSEGEGGRGVSVVHSPAETAAKAEALGFERPIVLQELAPGQDYCVAVLGDEGRAAAMMAYRNVTTFPRMAGAGALRETVDAEPFRPAVERVLQAADWTGLAEIDFRWTGQAADPPRLIEVNPRFWAGIFHSVQTAVDFPWLLYQQTIGQPLDPVSEPKIGARTKTTGIWLLAALEEITGSGADSRSTQIWQEIRARLSAGEWAALREGLAQATGVSSLGEILGQLRKVLSENRGAPSELSDAEDPLVGLGALFVLSSLIKHRRLPDELTYEASREPMFPRAAERASGRPIIGVTMPDAGDRLHWWALKIAVTVAGGRAIRLTSKAPRDPRTVDGLIFGGGSDVYPLRYEGRAKPGYRYDLVRGDLEASWAVAARRHDLPVLGICRGAQMLNVLAGGTLHGDLAAFDGADLKPSAWRKLTRREAVAVRKGSRLRDIVQTPRLRVNLIHQQAIDRLGVGLTVSARQTNGVVQAIEDRARRFWVGVQYHPELLIYSRAHRRLFASLVRAAGVRRAERLKA